MTESALGLRQQTDEARSVKKTGLNVLFLAKRGAIYNCDRAPVRIRLAAPDKKGTVVYCRFFFVCNHVNIEPVTEVRTRICAANRRGA